MSTTNASDDEMDWEEVVPDHRNPGDIVVEYTADAAPTLPTGNGRARGQGRKLDEAEKARTNAERAARLNSHKVHTITLLANASIRNEWLNDELLHARLLSITPLSLQNNFDNITKKNYPNKAFRGRAFEKAMISLTEWWFNEFEVERGPNMNVKSRTFGEVQQELHEKDAAGPSNGKMKGKAKEEDEGEIIRSSKSLMKHALMMRGSKDVSAQLFTALCRALSLPARLVVSLQSVPWKTSVGKPHTKPKPKPKPDPKGKGKEVEPEPEVEDDSDEDSMEEVVGPSLEQFAYDSKAKGKGKEKAFPGTGSSLNGKPAPKVPPKRPVINLRRSKPQGRRLGGPPTNSNRGPPAKGWPPVFWTEVFSRADGCWIPVDPSRNLVNQRKLFEPPPHDRNNRMVYVVALEEDGYGRDVTPRYAKEFGAKTAKIRLAGGEGNKEWWDGVVQMIARPYRLNRDDVEDAELLTSQMTEGMPTSLQGFKSHPLYILQRDLRREEIVHPAVVIGHFRGEPVYSRNNVIELKAAENWMKSNGREIKEGEQPLKWVKMRAVTTARKRAIEVAKMDGGDEAQQGLYAMWQTKVYVPPPVVDGKVPKNDFGNIDLYTPSMLPRGAVHLPYKGIAKVARKLEIDYAEAVTGFEFKQRRALPILSGVVVAAEHEEALLEAYWATAQAAEEKERQKKQERVFSRWKKLINSMKIRDRLMKEYSVNGTTQKVPDAPGEEPHDPMQDGGGFVVGGARTNLDDIVGHFSLPKMQHPIVSHAHIAKGDLEVEEEAEVEADDGGTVLNAPSPDQHWSPKDDEDDSMEDVTAEVAEPKRMPVRSMAELAAEAETVASERDSSPPPRPTRSTRASTASKIKPTPAPLKRTSLRSRASIKSSPQISDSSAAKKRTRKPARRRGRSSSTSEEEADEESSLSEEASPVKKTRTLPPPKAAGPTPGRTLRARKGKTEEQIREEREQERAYRRAIED